MEILSIYGVVFTMSVWAKIGIGNAMGGGGGEGITNKNSDIVSNIISKRIVENINIFVLERFSTQCSLN